MDPILAFGFSDVGGGEIIVIGIIALLLFGKNLPTASRNIGRALAEFKRVLNNASSEIKREMDAAAEDIKKEMDSTAQDMKQLSNEIKKDVAVDLSDSPKPALSSADAATSQPASPPELPPVPPKPPRDVAPAVSAAAQLDNLQRNIPAPTKIPPPLS